ncbi:MAG TPA: DUF3857 and transglutaminase domain-containing protein [Pyrinomonadaceae bacterium]|nr:DUF3857 and transglutaminase domain-containing protein [Pyrinomonadaceae bacterium]
MKPPTPLAPRRGAGFLTLTPLLIIFAAAAPAFAQKDWKPVEPSQLSMSAPVVERDADAEALFWEVRVSYENSGGEPATVLNHYVRIKIFTERGRESQSKIDIYAPKISDREIRIKDIAGRTIKPDGTVVELKKEDIFERDVVKMSGLKVKAKSFAMPAVEPGSIIEYRWREVRNGIRGYERFDFSRDIPVQLVRYFIKPYGEALVDDSGRPVGLRAQTFHGDMTPFVKESGWHSTSMTNVPAFREEPRMPPEYEVRPWMLVYYSSDDKPTPEKVWKAYGRELYEDHKSQMKVSDEIKRTAAEVVAGAATDDEKLDRLFAFVRSKVKNVDDDASGFTREQVEKMKENKNPSDTLKRGVGGWHDIDMLFAALATAAGFDARVAKVTDRSDTFFDPRFPDDYFMRLGSENIAVRVGDKWRFFDPGTTYIPQGMLRWQEEGQLALVSDPKEPVFVPVPQSGPEKSVEKRWAKFKLSADGTLEGEVKIEYTGHLAHDMKESYDEDSPAEREEALKEKFASRMSGIEITDVKVENVSDPLKPFTYTFRARVPGYAVKTGKRLLIQPAFFQKGSNPLFPTAGRRHHVYFNYPWSEEDYVEMELPEGYALDNPESPAPFGAGALSRYEPKAQVTTDGRTLIYRRKFFFGGSVDASGPALLFPTTSYEQLKRYFDELHRQDNHTLALKQGAAAAATTTSGNK